MQLAMLPAHPQRERLAIVIAARHDPFNPSLDRLTCLTACLRSVIVSVIRNQRRGKECWKDAQIVLVDDNSFIPLDSLLPKELLSFIQVLKNERTPGQAGALNHALATVPADVYAFTDSDCVVGQDWISAFGDHYSRFPTRVGIAGPNWLFADAAGRWSRFLTQQEAALARFIFNSYVDPEAMTTGRIDCRNLSLRADFLATYYGETPLFPEGQGPSVSGQASVNLRDVLAAHKLVVGYEPKAITYHKSIDSLRRQVVTYYRWGRYGDFSRIYSRQAGGLRRAFVRRYLIRHFVAPAVYGDVFWPYVALVHSAYWIGILRHHLRSAQS
jgi:glycosyltransferase involved in cell wall biosynthesis